MSKSIKQTEIDFFKSALTKDSEIMPSAKVLDWLKEKNAETKYSLNQIPLDKLKLWHFDIESGNLVHDTGKFFSIEGIEINTNWGKIDRWQQPIINQPEIGFLGILTKKINGVLHFLLQAKIEPGNLNIVQLSPTLQATKSNYTKAHKGNAPLFLEYFNGTKKVITLLDQLQSEQGARFLKKRNRNIIIEIEEEIEIPENFVWLTLGQIKGLIQHNNIINMDTRTVISGIPYGSYDANTLKFFSSLSNKDVNEILLNSVLIRDVSYKNLDQIISWITLLKIKYFLEIKNIPLKNVQDWAYDGMSIMHKDKKYFTVIGVNVEIGNREVLSWDQPMIKPAQEGIIAFLVKEINGIYHFLVQAKFEAGNFDIVELAPTVQCLTGNYRTGKNEYSVPFINDVLEASPDQIWMSTYQSEEGGRFYKEQNLNMIVEVKEDFPLDVPENYCWMTLNQILTFIKFNNYLNIAARSLISAISF
ncbi:MAG: NDP-hexose 2,3-dehydratase family protein [Cytophagaceae bacterium]|nr:NDP-hexose 2,3-dehydratase family protein [Cytophagaceae bacterium]MBK9933868.1 NDP-hexose 2,3-dehydratase family protein [Cytophagaceae bacterium]MBL0302415.1 NDP-hexose 2,3-dehydratase family protein [Cytophagaceae bacterium]MBL0325241.1 NDP-hexose 2,3-dehydratase family protein [Cytophagaceae bacterium]